MRFECDSCHAKYRISDEKVIGRVVRFPCRKCDNKILIDGRRDDVTVPAGPAYGYEEVTRRSEPAPFGHEAPTASRRRPGSPIRRRQSSVPPRRPSSVARRMSSSPAAASSALVGQHPGLALPVPKSKTVAGPLGAAKVDNAVWHVSINDVPIGPIRLEEMAHKVDAGAVSEYSLVWRDGLDEWRPLATVPELMSLLYERRSSGPPARSRFSSMPPFVEAQTAIKETPEPPAVPVPPKPPVHAMRGAAEVSAEFLPLADALQPDSLPPGALGQMSQPPAVLGPEPIFQHTEPSGAFSGLPQSPDEPISVPTVPPQPIAPDVRTGSSPWVWALMVAVAVFSAVLAVLAFDKYGDSALEKFLGPQSADIQRAPKATTPPPEVAAATLDEVPVEQEAEVVGEADVVDSEESEGPDEAMVGDGDGDDVEQEGTNVVANELAPKVAPPNPTRDGPAIKPARSSRRPRWKRNPTKAEPESATGIKKLGDDSLSAEEQKLLDDFGSSANAGVAKIDVSDSGSTKSKRDPLDNKAVSATVTTNKPRLQRCYERAIRGQRSPTAVRMNVSLNVASSGRVASVDVAGDGPGGLKECMEASIRRWRFPASSEGGPAKFPIVFSAN